MALLGTLATGLVSGQAVTEYTSLASWESAVSDVATYTILAPPNVSDGVVLPPLQETFLNGPIVFGPGTFTTPGNEPIIYDDGTYGSNVQYFAASPQANPTGDAATVNVAFSASSGVTALAFALGADDSSATIDVSVNGSALTPLAVSSAFPTAFLAVTDTGPITSISFTSTNEYYPNSQANPGEIDVIGSYATASAVATAPEIDTASATGAITLLVGGVAVLASRKRA